jgi:hypothetical protein
MLADILDLDELNTRAQYHRIGQLQNIRKELKRLSHLPSNKLFDTRTTFDTYAFHYGGRRELQFNVGLENIDGTSYLRHGVAFSLEPIRTLPAHSDYLEPKIERFNEFLRIHPDEYQDLRMWTWGYPHRSDNRSSNYPPTAIPADLITHRVFIFLGTLRKIDNVDIELILNDFDRLLPLYEYVEGTAIFPALTNTKSPFNFRPGCPVRLSQTTATIGEQKLDVNLRHNKLQVSLHQILSQRFGLDAVGIELSPLTGVRVDLELIRN